MNLRCVMMAAAVLAAPAAGASAQGYYGYGAPPPPPYVEEGASVARPACDEEGFTIVGAHAGVTVLGFGLNGGARFTAPTDCGGAQSGYAQGAPQFEPRPYAPPPPPPAYAPAPPYAQDYGYQGVGEQSYGFSGPPCGCDPQGW